MKKSELKIAHAVLDEESESNQLKYHLLLDHLNGSANFSEKFAEKFSNGDWAKAAALLHDLGKGSSEFQEYIRKVTGFEAPEGSYDIPKRGPNHSSHGAIWAVENWKGLSGKVLAYLISGHHAGLPDWHSEIGGGGCLSKRLNLSDRKDLPPLNQDWIKEATSKLQLPATPPCNKRIDLEIFHLWVRMLYSCLVDADFLNTEFFMKPEQSSSRNRQEGLEVLSDKFYGYMAALISGAEKTEINTLRQQIFNECQKAAEFEPGFFSLNVPTGGGKTLAGMAFALNHALKRDKKRIIVAIPFTSIIEQTAKKYKEIFGEHNVLEHHSNIDPEKETRQSRLASENWDAPIIVTTNVQLFESLFAAKSSRCRKLHNIVNSVIICDEAQMLPPEYLKPILSTMKGLVDFFRVSIVLCTATQPALTGNIGAGDAKFTGIAKENIRDIISDHQLHSLSKKFQRVEVHHAGKYDQWEELADELARYPQVLCVVNTRKNCRDLHALMPSETILLSANLCGEHRSDIIARIKKSLKNKEPVRVISTQLVEAGVDIDFPIVYRAMAGFDSIAQAAGRCNREGQLEKNGKLVKGKMVVFDSPKPPPAGFLRKGADAGAEIMRLDPQGCKNLQPDTFRKYFELFYSNGITSFDQKNMHSLLVTDAGQGECQFRTAAQKFRLIDDQEQVAVVVWYSGKKTSGQQLIGQLKQYGPDRTVFRKMQRFTVTLPKKQFLENKESIFEEIAGVWCQSVDYAYDETTGFVGLDMSPNYGAIIG